jgi:hypothetical protein
MEGHDHSHFPTEGGDDDLDELIQQFEARGYAPDGAEVGEAGEHGHGGHGGHEPGGHGHGAPQPRRFEHRGHTVEIVTHYAITIDGEPWEQPIEVHPDGSVSYHGLPQYYVASAVDIVKAVIDHGYELPDEIRAAVEAAREGE